MIQNIMDCVSLPSASGVLRCESSGLQTSINGKRDVWSHPDSYLIVKPPRTTCQGTVPWDGRLIRQVGAAPSSKVQI